MAIRNRLVLVFHARVVQKDMLTDLFRIGIEVVESLGLKESWEGLGLVGLGNDFLIIQITCTGGNIDGLVASLECVNLVSQFGFYVDVRGISRPGCHAIPRVEYVADMVGGLFYIRYSGRHARIHDRQQGVFGANRSRVQIGLEVLARQIALVHARVGFLMDGAACFRVAILVAIRFGIRFGVVAPILSRGWICLVIVLGGNPVIILDRGRGGSCGGRGVHIPYG